MAEVTTPETAAGPRRWAVFEDEDHVFMAVTEDGGDHVTWPEMGEDDVERMVKEHNDSIAEARVAALDEARAAVDDAFANYHRSADLARRDSLAAIDALRERSE